SGPPTSRPPTRPLRSATRSTGATARRRRSPARAPACRWTTPTRRPARSACRRPPPTRTAATAPRLASSWRRAPRRRQAGTLEVGDVVVGGRTGADEISNQAVGGGAVRVVLNGQDLGTFTLGVAAPGQGSVVVYGQAGDDQIALLAAEDGSAFPYAAVLFGGD